MPVNTQELLDAVSQLTDQQNLRVSLQQTAKWGAIIGGAAMLGGLLLGPRGLAVGGVLAGCTGAISARGSFKSVGDIIREDLTPSQQQLLATRLRRVITDLRLEDATLILPMLMGNQLTTQAVLSVVTSFITNELHLQLLN